MTEFLLDTDIDEIVTRLSDHAAETVVLASNEKIGVVSPFFIMSSENVSRMVVESTIDENKLKPFQSQEVSIVKA